MALLLVIPTVKSAARQIKVMGSDTPETFWIVAPETNASSDVLHCCCVALCVSFKKQQTVGFYQQRTRGPRVVPTEMGVMFGHPFICGQSV